MRLDLQAELGQLGCAPVCTQPEQEAGRVALRVQNLLLP